MLKKICTSFITFIILILLTTASAIFVLRGVLSGENLSNIINNIAIEEDGEGYLEKWFEPMIENSDYDYSNYLNEEEFELILGNYLEDYFKYQYGNQKEPSTKELQMFFEEFISKYEKETGIEIDNKYIYEAIDEFEEAMNEKDVFEDSKEVRTVFNFIYSNKIIAIIFGGIFICLLLIFLINRKIKSPFKSAATALFINGISFLLLSIGLSTILEDIAKTENLNKEILNSVYNSLNQQGIISLAIAIVIIIVLIIAKIIIKAKNKKDIKQEENTNVIMDNTTTQVNTNDINYFTNNQNK